MNYHKPNSKKNTSAGKPVSPSLPESEKQSFARPTENKFVKSEVPNESRTEPLIKTETEISSAARVASAAAEATSFKAHLAANAAAEEQERPVVKETHEVPAQPEANVPQALESKSKQVFANVQDAAKAAYAKSTVVSDELVELTKANANALVESSKILGAGLKTLGQTNATDGKNAINAVKNDCKELVAVRSPTELLQLQEKILRRNIGVAFAVGSKNTDALFKLTKDAAAPLSRRTSAIVERISTGAST